MAALNGASCTDCGDVKLTTKDVTVMVCVDNNEGSYTFCCPECRMRVAKPAGWGMVESLVASGCRFKTWVLPKELEEHRLGEPINHDYLLDFHEMLETEDFIDELHDYLNEARIAVRGMREERYVRLRGEAWESGEINNA